MNRISQYTTPTSKSLCQITYHRKLLSTRFDLFSWHASHFSGFTPNQVCHRSQISTPYLASLWEQGSPGHLRYHVAVILWMSLCFYTCRQLVLRFSISELIMDSIVFCFWQWFCRLCLWEVRLGPDSDWNKTYHHFSHHTDWPSPYYAFDCFH